MATGEVSTLRTRVTMDTVEFAKGAQEVNRELRLLKSESKLASTQMKQFGNSVGSQKNKLGVLSKEEVGLRKAIKLNRAEYDKYKRAQELSGDASQNNTAKMTSAANAMARNEEKLAKVRREMKLLNTEILRQESGWYQMGDGLEKAGNKVTRFSRGLNTFADHAMKVSAAVGIIGGLAIKSAIDWESAVVSMEKTIDATPQQMETLKNSIRDMALEVPLAATELGELAANAGQLGVEAEEIPKFTKVVADLSAATNIAGEEGSTMLAQFANVTQMDMSNIDRLGSSIALLGNNSATTEQDILEMSQLLAGAGESAGLAEPDIVGVAAALSSLGIASERGGSSFSKIMIEMAVASETGIEPLRNLEEASGMTRRELELLASNNSADFKSLADSLGMTTKEINNIVTAGGDLEGFAEVAGLSAEEFSQAFGENASNAIGLFIDGLAQGDAQSESTIQLLDDLGISEIRLRDTLLRTGNAQGLFNDTVDLANQGWDENTALTEEAERRYGSTESQLEILRNKLNDVAITAGERLLPAFNDMIDNADGIIEVVGDMVDWFVSLDDKTQQLAFTTGLMAVALGPVLKAFAGIGSAVGGLMTGSGKLIKFFADMAIKSEVASVGVSGVATQLAAGSTQAGAMTANMGLLSGVFGTTAGAILGTVGIVAAIAGIAVGLDALDEKLNGSQRRVEEWGFDIEEETATAVKSFQGLSDEAAIGTMEMAINVEEGAAEALGAYNDMVSDISTGAADTIAEVEETLAALPEGAREIMDEILGDRIAHQDEIVAEAERINTEINDIYARAVEENRELTEAELQVVDDYQKKLMDLRSETLGLAADEQTKVQAIMRDDLEKFSAEQLSMRKDYLKEELTTVQEGYDTAQEELDRALASDHASKEEHAKKTKALAEERRDSELAITAELAQAMMVGNEELAISTEHKTTLVRGMVESMGFEYEEVMLKIAHSSIEAGEATAFLAKDLADMSDETTQANETWNNFVLENKIGEVDTNVKEVIQEASESEEGWKDLEFILKNAELTTTARAAIEEALIANGTWEEMDFDPQSALLFTNALSTAKEYLESEGIWDNLTLEEQTAILDTNTPEQLEQILRDVGVWDGLHPDVQNMIVKSDATEKAQEGKKAIDGWNKLDPKDIGLNVTSNASSAVSSAQRAINRLTGKTVGIGAFYKGAPYRRDYNGTNSHPGGYGILGDGGKQEPFMTPQGDVGLSPDTDTMYNLPKGTKVWSSIARFKADAQQNTLLESLVNKLPHFATGTEDSFLENSKFPNVFSGNQESTNAPVNNFTVNINATGDLPYSTVQKMARQIEKELKRAVDSNKLNKGV